MSGRTVSISINSKPVFIGLSDGSDGKSFEEMFDLSDLDKDALLDMAEQGVIHFAEKEIVKGGRVYVE